MPTEKLSINLFLNVRELDESLFFIIKNGPESYLPETSCSYLGGGWPVPTAVRSCGVSPHQPRTIASPGTAEPAGSSSPSRTASWH